MASIATDPNGGRRVQFVASDGTRKTIRLGKLPLRQAEAIRLRIEALNAAIKSRCPLDDETARWVGSIGDELADKLARVGLIPGRAASTLGAFLDRYIAGRTDAKPNTIANMRGTQVRLVKFFGESKSLRSITEADGDNFAIWLKTNYGTGTVGREIKRTKQFLKAARRAGLIPTNPLEDLKGSAAIDESRQAFISVETIEKLLGVCPSAEWRLILSLARYGGIRIPSELVGLTWDDVLWDQNKFRVRSPKTEHHEGKSERWVPIYPELKPHLEAAFDAAPEGAVHVVREGLRGSDTNLRTGLLRIIRKAGLSPWPKLFTNLRSSRQTELAASYPAHVVCAWQGNSQAIAAKHYLQVRDEDFQRGAECGALEAQKAAQQQAAGSGTISQGSPQTQADCDVMRDDAPQCHTKRHPREESKHSTQAPDTTRGLRRSAVQGGAESGAVADPDLAILIEAWPGLPERTRRAIMDLAQVQEVPHA